MLMSFVFSSCPLRAAVRDTNHISQSIMTGTLGLQGKKDIQLSNHGLISIKNPYSFKPLKIQLSDAAGKIIIVKNVDEGLKFSIDKSNDRIMIDFEL